MAQKKGGTRIPQFTEDIFSRPPKEILEELRKFIGVEMELSKGDYPVEYDPISRFCQMTDDTNPLYLDPEYARKTDYGEVVCPPLMTSYFGGQYYRWPPSPAPRLTLLPFPPADGPYRTIALGRDWTFFKPVKVGDRLSTKNRVVDAYLKATRSDPEAIWTVTETTFTNQNGEVVAVMGRTGIHYKR